MDENQKYGCQHYVRKCKIVSPCCQKIYPCRICHDDEMYVKNIDPKVRHQINRHEIKEVICSLCGIQQSVKQYCEACEVCFGSYFCDICNLFDDEDKKQFHCDKCGICRLGGRENSIHCDNCNICVLKIDDNHKCHNIKGSTCSVCMEDLFVSRCEIMQMKCGHFIHTDCLHEMAKNTFKYKVTCTCPICSASIIETDFLNKLLDSEIEATPMPNEYKDIDVKILCNDCHQESTSKFHIIGMKCYLCGGYNTRNI
jgi:RING finger/CHY zinc finger protein 1